MKVHVTVRGVAPLYKIFGKKNDIDLEFPGNMVKDLVDGLIRTYGADIKKALLDAEGDIDMELRVFVNDKDDHLQYGQRLNRVLNEGDTIYILGAGIA
jgi:molybdopterin converting factor small subunit